MTKIEDRRRAREKGRGRGAEEPQDIPPPGWKDVAVRLWYQIDDDHVTLVAAGVAFYSLLALFPLLAALVSVYGLIAQSGDIEQHLEKLAGILPSAALDIVRQQLVQLSQAETPKLSLVFVGAFLFSLWSANKGVASMFEAMNIAYGEREKRGYFKLNAITLLFTFGFILFIVVALIAIVAVPPLLDFLGLGAVEHSLISFARWPLLLIIVILGNALVYRYGPSRETARWVWLSWGSVMAAVLWLVASALFSFYAANFASYNETYGSMGAVIAVMTWIWLSAVIVIAGAELNAELEHQTARDTTTGRDRPLGVRGAEMADTVGPSAEQTRRSPILADKPGGLSTDERHIRRKQSGPAKRDARAEISPLVRWIGRFLVSAIREKTGSPESPRQPR